jgi:histidinol-phosphate aminotransferase
VSLEHRVKPHIAKLEPYQPGKRADEVERELGVRDAVRLASNENPCGPSPRAIAAVQELAGSVDQYPDRSCRQLRSRLAEHVGGAPEQVIVGAGSDEIIELLAKVFLGPGDEMICPWPSFAMYRVATQSVGARLVRVALDDDLVHDLDAMAATVTERTRIVVVCNPNNPTGTSVSREAFDRFAAALPDDVVLVVDEAYVEYAQREDFPDTLAWTRRRPGTLALRTFSKLYGLAGLRVGYGIADADLCGWLERVRPPFGVTRLAEAAACAALDDREHIERSLRVNAEGLQYLEREIAALGYRIWPSDASFVLVRVAPGVGDALMRLGVIVRSLDGFGLPDCVRVSVGNPEANERCVKALRHLREGGASSLR